MNAPRIWVPKFKIIEPKSEFSLMPKLRGRYRMARIGPDGRTRQETPWFDNLILDNGLDRLGSNREVLTRCVVGTGSTAPAVGDTSLANFLAGTVTVQTTQTITNSVTPYGVERTTTYRFGQGVAAGNLTEVGIGWLNTDLWSRALIEDGTGTPTTLTVQADEFLDVTYQLTMFPPLADVTGTIDISGTNYDYTMRACNVETSAGWDFDNNYDDLFLSGFGGNAYFENEAYDGAIGATVEDQPTGSFQNADSGANSAYVGGSHQRAGSVTWNLGSANFVGGIDAFKVVVGDDPPQGLMTWQIAHTPAIPKTDSEVLTLNYTHSWARA